MAVSLVFFVGPGAAAGKKGAPEKPAEIPFGEPYLLGGIGAKGLLEKYQIVIVEVEAGSPADLGKLAVGDKIVGLKIPGLGTAFFKNLSATESPFTQLISLLTRIASGPKERCKLTLLVDRQGKLDEYVVRPERTKKHGKSCPKKCKQCETVIQEALNFLAASKDSESAQKSGAAWTVEESIRGLAFVASGTTPQEGTYVKPLRDCLKRVVEGVSAAMESSARYQKSGDQGEGGGRMENWTLGFGGLFLAELYAKFGADALSSTGVQVSSPSGGKMTPGPGALPALLGEIAKTIAANQEASGGWGHGGPLGVPNDLNYIEVQACGNWCLAALGRMDALDIPVPSLALKKAVAYAKSCNENGGITYAAGARYRGSGQMGRTGATLFAFWCGALVKDEPLFSQMERFVEKNIDKLPDGHASPTMHFLACGLGASRDGCDSPTWKEFWENYIPKMESLKRSDGSFALWPSDVGNDPKWKGLIPESQLPPNWPTATHALLLQLPRETIFEPPPKKKKRRD